MSRGVGKVQRAVLAVVDANPEGLAINTIVEHLHGAAATRAQQESVRRAVRTLRQRQLVTVTARRVRSPRRSRRRIFDLSGCEVGFCSGCARRLRRFRLQNWHRQAMNANARHDPGWLDDLAAAEASGFVHCAASDERLVATDPSAVDQVHHWQQLVLPRNPDAP
jgi:hypothetical protein